MSYLFENNGVFNEDISGWDVSKITNMRSMFSGATSFNRDLSSWNVTKVTDMFCMFKSATSFNQNIGSWKTGKVAGTGLDGMFWGATSFNQDIGGWDVTGVTNMVYVFKDSAFNMDISAWDVSRVTGDMIGMFQGAKSFNQNIGGWTVSKVTNMRAMFKDATSFNQGINDWDVSRVTSMEQMFFGATSFNQVISDWDVSRVTNMEQMFFGATSFNKNLCAWKHNQFPYDQSGQMFENSGCVRKGDPSISIYSLCGSCDSVRHVRVSMHGYNKIITLSEVQVFAMVNGVETNVALASSGATATQSSTYGSPYPASNAINGQHTGQTSDTSSTHFEFNPWWVVKLKESYEVTRVVVWNRMDCCSERLTGAILSLQDVNGNILKSYNLGDTRNQQKFEFRITDNSYLRSSFSYHDHSGLDRGFQQQEAFDEASVNAIKLHNRGLGFAVNSKDAFTLISDADFESLELEPKEYQDQDNKNDSLTRFSTVSRYEILIATYELVMFLIRLNIIYHCRIQPPNII